MHPDPDVSFESATPIVSVVDLQRALAFWEQTLGFARAWTWGDPPGLASVCRGQVEINLGQRGEYGPAGPSQVYVRVQGIEALWRHLATAGAAVRVPIADRPYGLRDFSIEDESGNRFDFGEPLRESAETAEETPVAEAVKPLVPAHDLALCRRFYLALGFRQNWQADGIAELELAGFRLLLHDGAARSDAGKGVVLHVEVPDADAWSAHARRVVAGGAFGPARVEGPRSEPWGYRVTYVHDPTGVELRLAQPLARPGAVV